MCSFIGGYLPKFENNKADQILKLDKEFIELLNNVLLTKGGDNFGLHFFLNNGSYKTKIEIYEDSWEKFRTEVTKAIWVYSSMLEAFLAFSRLTPEMEKTNSIPQPYVNKKDNCSTTIHGTIPGVDAKKYNTDTDIALDLVHFHLTEEVERLNGKISMLTFRHEESSFQCYHNGLGLYKNSIVYDIHALDYYTNINYNESKYHCNLSLPVGHIFSFTKGVVPRPNFGRIAPKYEYNRDEKEYNINLGCLFSGGLDALCSIQKQIVKEIEQFKFNGECFLERFSCHRNTDNKVKVNLNVQLYYLDWGTRASEQEIKATQDIIKPLSTFIKSTFERFNETYFRDEFIFNHSCGFEVFNVKPLFTNILEVVGIKNVRLTDKKASGKGLKEAEEAISYVPYRNTFMLNLIAAMMEERFPNQDNKIVIGANLTEGMVYLDNSENYITKMNEAIKLGGQKTMYTNIVAPYMNMTKTKMIEDVKKIPGYLPIGLSYSCYFPLANGKECGKCGSCLLRKNAILRNEGK